MLTSCRPDHRPSRPSATAPLGGDDSRLLWTHRPPRYSDVKPKDEVQTVGRSRATDNSVSFCRTGFTTSYTSLADMLTQLTLAETPVAPRQKIHVEPLPHVLEQVGRLLSVGQLLVRIKSRSPRWAVVDLLSGVVPFVITACRERTKRSRHH